MIGTAISVIEMLSSFTDLPGAVVNNIQDISKGVRSENKSLKEQNEILLKRLGAVVDDERKLKSYLKVTILKNMAWKDDELHNNEKCIVMDYILNNSDLPIDDKVIFLIDINNKPRTNFKKMIFGERYKFNMLFNSLEEGKGFKTTLTELSESDGEVTKEEEQYLIKLLKQLNL